MKNLFHFIVSLFVCSYGLTQDLEWAKNIGGSGDDRCFDFTRDAQGHIYITGGFNNSVNFNPGGTPFLLNAATIDNSDIYIAKYDAASNLLWARSLGNSEWEMGLAIETDSSNNVYVIGNYRGYLDFDPGEDIAALNASIMSYFLAKYDSNGSFLWVRDIGNDGNDYLTLHQSKLFIDKNNQAYTYINQNDTLKKFNSEGQTIWQKQLSGAPEMGAKQHFYFVKGFKSATSNSTNFIQQDSLFLQKVDTNGNQVFSNLFGTTHNGSIGGYIQYDENGNVFLSGQFWGDFTFMGLTDTITISNHDLGSGNVPIKKEFIAKIDTLGFVKWVHFFNGASPHPYIIRTNANGDIFTLGQTNGATHFDWSSSATIATSWDHYIAKYDSSFHFQACSIFLGGSGNDYTGNFNIYGDTALICGHFFNTIDLDLTNSSFNLSAAPPEHIFMAKYANFDIVANSASINLPQETFNQIQVYPNPSSGIISIHMVDISPVSILTVYDVFGKQLLNKTLIDKDFEINLSNFPNGLYFLNFIQNDELRSIQLIKNE